MERSPVTSLEAALSLVFRRRLYLCDEPIAGVVHDNIESTKVLFHLCKRRIDLLNRRHVERQDKQLRRGVLVLVLGKNFRPPQRGDYTLVGCQNSVEQSSAYALRCASDYRGRVSSGP